MKFLKENKELLSLMLLWIYFLFILKDIYTWFWLSPFIFLVVFDWLNLFNLSGQSKEYQTLLSMFYLGLVLNIKHIEINTLLFWEIGIPANLFVVLFFDFSLNKFEKNKF